ncbi:MAG: putative transport system permease protein [Pseudonocardiales bacterium]|nr:putative transport system permease protein [Pseudonocardiales bacterium]
MIRLWIAGLIRKQPGRLLVALGVAIAVALLASIGAFVAHAKATMTSRAIRSVAVDWQIQAQPGTNPDKLLQLVRTYPAVQSAAPVGFAQASGFTVTTGASTQVTGAGLVLGLPPGYRGTFPGEIRTLAGSGSGVLLAQQTGANLHAQPGTEVHIELANRLSATVTVNGIVDLPQANSLFQTVGAPSSAQPTAPPDNVLLLPYAQWRSITAPLAHSRPDLVTSQIHVRLHHSLPADPAAAYAQLIGTAHNLEARSVGSALVGNNLAAALDGARSDAAYAQVIFLFLGLPGVALAALLSATVAAAAAGARRREQALLRVRGAAQRQLLRLVAAEAALVGVLGCALGLGAAAIVGRITFGSARFGATTGSALLWAGLATAAGVVVTAGAVLIPARRDLREQTVAASRQEVPTPRTPMWARYGLDIAALIGAGLAFSATRSNGYQLVVAPEGVPTISISYWALAAPALLWIGAGLLIWRLADLLLGRGRRATSLLLRPLAGRIAPVLGSSMARRRRPLVRATALVGLAIAFAISTSAFNSTYRNQAEVDAQLTNGADVTVTEPPAADVGPGLAAQLAKIPGVNRVEPMLHRYAYVGSDLQDIYGVRPGSIRSVTAVLDSYFSGGTAAQLMHTLQTHPDAVLVSAETVRDYQLHPGDLLKLRLVNGRTHQQVTVPFHYAGIVAEFPTAPRDSFFVANSSYLAARTGSSAVGDFLINTGGQNVTSVAAGVRALVGTSATVTDLNSTRGAVGSSLTSVDLAGLTRVELAFALILAAASGALVLGLGLAERRRSLAIMSAVGARRRHLFAAIAGETTLVGVGGAVTGAVLGGFLAAMLVKVLTGVFDPPPTAVSVPWGYVAALALLFAGCLAAVVLGTLRVASRSVLDTIRRL